MQDNKNEKREARRKKRIRSQIISYIVLVILVVVVFFLGYRGYKAAAKKIEEINKPSESLNEIAESMASENTTGVITSPDEFVIEPESGDESVSEENVTEPVNQNVKDYVDNMSIEQKVSALFMVSPESLTGVDVVAIAGEGTKNALSTYGVSGLIYEDKNIVSAEQFKEMLTSTKDMYKELYNSDIWLAVKEEGAVNTLAGSSLGIEKVPAAGEYSEEGEDYQAFLTIGNYLNEYGINMNLGVCGDIKKDESSAIGNRAFGMDGETVSLMVTSAVKATIDSGISPCITGFIGRGAATNETNIAPATVELSEEEIAANVDVYKKGALAGADCVMLSNTMVAGLTNDLPCSLSPEAVSLLRENAEYNGVIMTDYLDESAITDKYSAEEIGVMAICAGADIIVRPADFKMAYDGIMKAIVEGVITEERINESLYRIYSVKMQ